MRRAWNFVAAVTRGADHLLNAVIALMLIVAILFSGYSLWDNWKIYHNAGVSDALLEYKPSADDGNANPTLSELQAINPDVCAWLTVDNTNIDYPVVQGESNWTYLNWAVDNTFSLSGSIFLDYRNARDFSDSYSIIYGHHMEGNVMFGELPNFLEADYFESHASGVLFTPADTYQIEWIACVETDAYDSRFYTPIGTADSEQISELLSNILSAATQFRNVEVSTNDRLVALSTCSNLSTDGRVILIGRLSQQDL